MTPSGAPHRGLGPAPIVDGLDLDESVRRVSMRRFPYSVVYLDERSPIVVLAVAHQSRVPHYWTVRVPDEPGG